ncbi:SEC-C domain-containing protein [Anaerobacillus sp. MEB173]|uniref:SEC-C domain-containing protein n=1 Tax=Anaerobacillus sp. MEB173 TaxID=3383345 RepID=UPI003F93D68E
MSINRNSACPCGSGKKYKKCCLNKTEVIELNERKEQRFFERKGELRHRLVDFIDKQLTLEQDKELFRYFSDKMSGLINQDIMEPYFRFWATIIHRFENGLRAVEWMWRDAKGKLDSLEREMLESWVKMVPRIIQYIDKNDNGIVVEDIMTKEQFYLPYCESIHRNHVPPWSIALSFLEPYKEGHCLHGVTLWTSPDRIQPLVNEVNRLRKDNGEDRTVITENYLELLTLLLQKEDTENKNKVVDINLTYTINNSEHVFQFFTKRRDDVLVNDLNNSTKTGLFAWIGDMYSYEDTEIDGAMYLAEIYGLVKLTKRKLSFETLNKDKAQQFSMWLEEISDYLKFEKWDEKYVKTKVASKTEVQHYCVAYEKGNINKDYGRLAQSMVQMDKMFTKKTETDEHLLADIEQWFKEKEFESCKPETSLSENFNYLRKKLGLPLSPFITGGESRETIIRRCENMISMFTFQGYSNDDISLLEMLQFTPETARAFYTTDVLSFFKEKTTGKSKATENKYASALPMFVRFCDEELIDGRATWQTFGNDLWDKLINHRPELYKDMTKTQLTAFDATLKTFTRWIDEKYETGHHQVVKEMIDENGERLKELVGIR